jgi:hypothetical protein
MTRLRKMMLDEPTPSAALSRTVSATLYTAPFLHSISIGPASAATTSGFLLAA